MYTFIFSWNWHYEEMLLHALFTFMRSVLFILALSDIISTELKGIRFKGQTREMHSFAKKKCNV